MSVFEFGCNTDGMMDSFQCIQRESEEDADFFIHMFTLAAENGVDINEPELQEEIFSGGNLGGFDALLPHDQQRVLDACEKLYNKYY